MEYHLKYENLDKIGHMDRPNKVGLRYNQFLLFCLHKYFPLFVAYSYQMLIQTFFCQNVSYFHNQLLKIIKYVHWPYKY